jgi:hypothetical protein
MMHSFLDAIIAFFSLVIIKDNDAFFNCPTNIEALFIVSSVFMLNPAKTVDRFSAVLSASVKSLF